MRILDAVPADLDAAVEIERLSFPDPWSATMFRAHLEGGVNTFIIAETAEDERARNVMGFAIAHTVADESELLNIAVHPTARGHGVGTILLDSIISRCVSRGARSMVLDVRESNTAALALYTRHGFTQVGRRRRYYYGPEEDGLVLRAILPVSTGIPVVSQ